MVGTNMKKVKKWRVSYKETEKNQKLKCEVDNDGG